MGSVVFLLKQILCSSLQNIKMKFLVLFACVGLSQAGVLVSNAPANHFQAATAPADHFLAATAPADHFSAATAPAAHFNAATAPAGKLDTYTRSSQHYYRGHGDRQTEYGAGGNTRQHPSSRYQEDLRHRPRPQYRSNSS